MIQNYVKLAWRNLLARKLVSTINIIGLSIAIGSCVAVYLFLKNILTADNFHRHADRIFMAEYTVQNDGTVETWGNSPMPLGPALAEKFPQVERAVRIENEWVKVYAGDDVFDEMLTFADTGFFEMFTFPLAQGSAAALSTPNTIIISHAVAEKYFPGESALGKTLTAALGLRGKRVLTIGGVAATFPENTGLRFSLLTDFGALTAFDLAKTGSWASMTRSTFLQLKPGTDIAALEKNMAPFVALHNAASPERPIQTFRLDNLANPNPGAYDVINRPVEAPHPLLLLIFVGLALIMFALSCINYVNIALGQAARRLKEIGVRKAVGGQKWQLAIQFMSENLLLCFIALLFGLVLTEVALVPYFNSIFVEKISLRLDEGLGIWAFFAGLLLLTGIASGAYPALYVSSFRTVSILRGKAAFSTRSKLTGVFLCLQFVLAFGTVISGVLFKSLANHWEKLPWGYRPDQTLVVRLDEEGQADKLRNEALRNPHVVHIGSASSHVGEGMAFGEIFIGNEAKKVVRYEVGAGYFESLGMPLAQGRFFDPRRRAEDERMVVVNQAFLKKHKLREPLGAEIRADGKTYTVNGVVQDFRMTGTAANEPAVFFLAADTGLAYLTLRYQPGAGKQVEAFMKTAWAKLGTPVPFLAFHQNLVFDSQYQAYKNVTDALGLVAGLALLIACLGLFGLASQNYAARLKESSIRKVLGASAGQIILRANRSFLLLLLTASLLATGICFVGFQLLLRAAEQFTGKVSLGALPYLLANLLVFLLAAGAVGWQSFRLARVVPAETLRGE